MGGSLSLEVSKMCSTAKANLPWCWMSAMRVPVPFCWHFWDCQWPLSTRAPHLVALFPGCEIPGCLSPKIPSPSHAMVGG